MRKSFTLIELIVVIGIIAILSGLGASAYNGFQQSARDTRRKNDLKTITSALNAYYANNGRFPPPSSACTSGCCHVKSTAGSDWIAALVPDYIEELPVDPINKPTSDNQPWLNSNYGYTYGNLSTDGQTYDLTTRLENAQDPDRSAVKDYIAGTGCGFTWHWNTIFSGEGTQVYELSPGS